VRGSSLRTLSASSAGRCPLPLLGYDGGRRRQRRLMNRNPAQRGLYAELFQRKPGRILPEQGRIRRCLDALGRPERHFPSMLIVGTNGKGSTAAMLASMLTASGLKVGRYTSPHLVDVRERIVVDGERISLEDFSELLELMREFPELSFFEALTVMAFEYFSRRAVDIAVLEAGMGGKWDATRTAGSGIAGLSSIGLDHTRWLGGSITEIAADKGAALRAAEVGIIASGVDEGLRPALGAPEVVRASAFVELAVNGNTGRPEARFPDGRHLRLDPPLRGRHQLGNLQLALALGEAGASLGWYRGLDEEAVTRGLRHCSWPGRLSEVRIRGRRVLLDGAHNVEAAGALAEELDADGESFDLLFSCLDDKPVEGMAALLRPRVKRVALCSLEDERAMDPERLQKSWPDAGMAPDPLSGLELLGPRVVAAGSLRLVGALLTAAAQEEGVEDVG